MATEKDFAPTDWQRVEAAPFMAGLAVSYGDLSNKVAIGDEARATGDAIKAASSSPSEVVRTIATRFAQGQRPTIPAVPNKPAEAQAALIDGCKAAAALVAAKAPGEATTYAHFLLDCAKAAAGAAREGGFIGVGVRKVSEGEELALANLALALGLPG
jgi:hypothetical protein